jgi:CelD/BcsL family acetyltransferase involved in cellulose biosynthesis
LVELLDLLPDLRPDLLPELLGASLLPIRLHGRLTRTDALVSQCGGERLTAHVATTTRELEDLAPAWNALHDLARSVNPFNQWAWVYEWWRVYGRSRGWVRDRLQIYVYRDSLGAVRAIVPLVVTSFGVGPLSIRKLRSFGAVPQNHLTELPEPLVCPGWEEATASALADVVRAPASHHWCDLEGLPLDGSLGQWFASRAESTRGWTHRRVVRYYTLSLPDSWETLRGTLKPHIKKHLRNSHAALARDGHDWTFDTVVEAGRMDDALSEFYQLHQARARAGRGPHHPDHFSTATSRRFLQAVAQALAADRRFMICRLLVRDRVLATRLVLVSGSCFYLYHSAFDPAWWRYSLGTSLVGECIKFAIRSGFRTVNLSTGNDSSKARWGPDEHLVGGVRIPSARAGGAWMVGAEQLTHRFAPHPRETEPISPSSQL